MLTVRRAVLAGDIGSEDPWVSDLYHEASKLSLLQGPSTQSALEAVMGRTATVFGDSRTVPLKPGEPNGACHELLRKRRSCRAFAESPINLRQLSSIVDGANGVTAQLMTETGRRHPLRAFPTAGGLNSTDLFLVAANVRELEDGLYFHQPSDRNLALLAPGDMSHEINGLLMKPKGSITAPVTFLLTCNIARLRLKYGERGYRFGFLEMGHLMQSLWMLSDELGLGFLSIGGFNDDKALDLLPIDGVDVILGYVGLLGNKVI